jgi:4-amino-4-deoxy-L-arabinose transferase-like glycosyltransferase
VVALTVLAAGLRLWRLDVVPLGLHGDEAWTGIDAQRVLNEGWIGPYVLSALGQPIGPVYWTAAVFTVLPETTFVLRLSMAVFGIASIPLAYYTFRLMFDRVVGAFAAFLLAVMAWHLHLSRTAFMVQVQPFIELLVLLVLVLAIRRRRLVLFALAGLLAGAGVYVYNAYLLFLPVPLVAIAWTFARGVSDGNRLGFGIIALALFVAPAVLISVPMIQYAHDNTFDWRYHQKVVNVTEQDTWKDASLVGKAELITDRAWEWQRGLAWGDRYDLGDGLATSGHPPVEPLVYALAIIGLLVSIWNWKRTEYAVLLAAALLLPWGALLTVEDGLFRRTLGLAPFVAVFAAIPLAWLWRRAQRDHARFRYALMAGVLVIPALTAVKTTYDYFGPVQDTFAMKFVYPYEMDAASHYVDELPKGTLIYFYSSKWSYFYETRVFIAQKRYGLDRSAEFGYPSEALVFTADRTQDVAFIFLDEYLRDFDTVASAYPDGIETVVERNGETLYRAYFLPAQP